MAVANVSCSQIGLAQLELDLHPRTSSQAFAGAVYLLQATAMLFRLSVLLPLVLVGLVYNANAQVNQIAGTSLYPEELIPLITRADALLTAGQFNDAAKAYSEAIGECG